MQCHGRLNDMQNMEIIVFYFERKAQSNCPHIHFFQLLKALVNKTIILSFMQVVLYKINNLIAWAI